MDEYLVIVARDQPDLCDYLARSFSEGEKVQVLLDRRRGKRRQRVQAHEPERRRVECRCQPSSDRRSLLFVTVRQSD